MTTVHEAANATFDSPQARSARDQVLEYYAETWFDYRSVWMNPTTRALHFGVWDASTTSHADSLLAANRILADHADVGPGTRVLDAGCGVGGTSMWLAAERGADVVGIAIVPDQIERARRYAAERGLDDRVRFEVADYLNTGFPSESFDVVVAQESVCHTPSKLAFLAECRRLLRPGGRLVMIDYIGTGAELSRRDRRLMNSWITGWAIQPLLEISSWGALAQHAGLALNETEDLTPLSSRSCRRLYRLCVTLWPIAGLLALVGQRSQVAQRNLAASRDQWRLMRRGLWRHMLLRLDLAKV
jgi:cyclopropane fatty-acyl-phospholipid synthase-like methyltransferase